MTQLDKLLSELAIGKRTATGAVKISQDHYVSEWVWKYAPFKARPANAASNNWRVDRKDGVMESFQLTEEKARERADELNTLAAAVELLRE